MNRPHKKLDVWKAAMDLVIEVYRLTEKFPKEERFGLTVQVRKAVVSIPSNIAEGASRNTKKEFVNFLYIAQGSLSELDAQLEIAYRLGYIGEEDFAGLDQNMDRIGRMLTGLIHHQKE